MLFAYRFCPETTVAQQMNTSSDSKKSIPVQVRLRKETIDRIEYLRAATGRNRTQVIVDALALLYRLVEVQQSGGSILLEKPDGKTIQIEYVGL